MRNFPRDYKISDNIVFNKIEKLLLNYIERNSISGPNEFSDDAIETNQKVCESICGYVWNACKKFALSHSEETEKAKFL